MGNHTCTMIYYMYSELNIPKTRGGHCIGACSYLNPWPGSKCGQAVKAEFCRQSRGQDVKLDSKVKRSKFVLASFACVICRRSSGQGTFLATVKRSRPKFWYSWVKILTPVADASTSAYVVYPPCERGQRYDLIKNSQEYNGEFSLVLHVHVAASS